MKYVSVILCLVALLISSCGSSPATPSEQSIQTAIAETKSAQNSAFIIPLTTLTNSSPKFGAHPHLGEVGWGYNYPANRRRSGGCRSESCKRLPIQ